MTTEEKNLKCTNPILVDQADVLAAVEDEARPEFTEHLKSCLFCRNEVAEYSKLSSLFSTRLGRKKAEFRENCPNTQAIIDYTFNLLKGQDSAKVETHLQGCTYCQADYALYQQDFAGTPTGQAAIGNVVAALTDAAISLIRKIPALLVPAVPSPQLTAFRLQESETNDADETFEFQAEDVTVVLQMQLARTSSITGIVNRNNYPLAELDNVRVNLIRAEQTIASDNLDDTGSFFFEFQLGKSALKLEICFPDLIVIVTDFQKS